MPAGSMSLISQLVSIVRMLPAIRDAAKPFFAASELSRAIAATEAEHPVAENLLAVWTSNAHFRGVVQSTLDGRVDADDADLIASFVAATGFDAGPNTNAEAQAIVKTFLINLASAHHEGSRAVAVLGKRLERQHEQTQQGLEILTTEVRSFTARLEATQAVGRTGAEEVHHAKVDSARELLLEGKHKSARSLLTKVREQVDRKASKHLAFRIATNLGAAAMALNDLDLARDEFNRALELQEDSKALTNLAQIDILQDRLSAAEELIERARVLAPDDNTVLALKIEILKRTDRWDELDRLEVDEPSIQEYFVTIVTLANARLRARRYVEAEQLARRALALEPANENAFDLLAQAIAVPTLEDLRQQPPLIPSPAQRARLREAETAFSAAVDRMADHEAKGEIHRALVNRSAVRLALGDVEQGLADANRVLSAQPDSVEALANKSRALINLDRHGDAVPVLERLQGIRPNVPTSVELGLCWLHTGKVAQAVDVLKRAWEAAAEPDRPRVGGMLLRAYIAAKRATDAEELAEVMQRPEVRSPMSFVAIAKFRDGQGDEPAAKEALDQAASLAGGAEAELITFEIAIFHYFHRRFAEAAEHFGRLSNMHAGNPALSRYVSSLYRSGDLEKALEIAREVRASGVVIPAVMEVEATILESIGDLDGALILRIELGKIEPDDLEHQLIIAHLFIRQNKLSEAKSLIERLAIPEGADWDILLNAAKLRAILGLGGVLELAYTARRKGFDRPEPHFTYISLFLSRDQLGEDLRSPDQAGLGTTIHLRRGSEISTYTIVEASTKDLRPDEQREDSALAQKLIGAKKGQSIDVTSGRIEDLAFEVVDVQSKFVFAFQQTLANFATWFPDDRSIEPFSIKENDFAKVFTLLDRRSAAVAETTAAYKAGRLTIGGVAHLAGVTELDVWGSFATSETGAIMSRAGDAEESRVEREALSATDGVVLDITTLITLDYLGLGDVLSNTYTRLFVAQAVLDSLQEQIVQNQLGPVMAGTMGKSADGYTHAEVTPEQLHKYAERFVRLRDFYPG